MISILSLLYNECSKLEKYFITNSIKGHKKGRELHSCLPLFFNLNLNYEKSNVFGSKYANYNNTLVTLTCFCSLVIII